MTQLYAVTGDRVEAEDAVQEAFARAVDTWGSLTSARWPDVGTRSADAGLPDLAGGWLR